MVQRKTRRRALTTDDVARVFDHACIARLVRIGKMPAGADKKLFGEGVREAARIYAREARTPNANILNDEIAGLHRAADQRLYAQVADLLERLSPRAHRILLQRGSRIGTDLPEPEAVLDSDRREN